MTRSEILQRADEIVNGAREQQYGKAEDNFALIGALWSAYLGIEVTALDVANLMCLFKLGRIRTGTATDDSFVDLVGYAACGGEIAGHRREKLDDIRSMMGSPYTDD